jgi:hypothetical protein
VVLENRSQNRIRAADELLSRRTLESRTSFFIDIRDEFTLDVSGTVF